MQMAAFFHFPHKAALNVYRHLLLPEARKSSKYFVGYFEIQLVI